MSVTIDQPSLELESLLAAVEQLREGYEVLTGQRGDPLDRAVTVRELEEGAVSLQGLADLIRLLPGATPGIPGQIPSIPDDTEPDYTTPPRLENVVATASLTTIILMWDDPGYTNWGAIEIWRAQEDDLGQAIRIDTTTANIYADAVGSTGTRFYYWVRIVSAMDVEGPYQSVAGVTALTGLVGGSDLSDLIIEADHIAAGAVESDKLADGSVVHGKLAANAIVAGDAAIANAAIRNAQISDLAADKITTGFLAAARILAGSLHADKLEANTIETRHIKAAGVHGDRITAGTLAADRIVANSITSTQLAAGAVTADNIQATAIKTVHIEVGAVSAPAHFLGGVSGVNLTGLLQLSNYSVYLGTFNAQGGRTILSVAATVWLSINTTTPLQFQMRFGLLASPLFSQNQMLRLHQQAMSFGSQQYLEVPIAATVVAPSTHVGAVDFYFHVYLLYWGLSAPSGSYVSLDCVGGVLEVRV